MYLFIIYLLYIYIYRIVPLVHYMLSLRLPVMYRPWNKQTSILKDSVPLFRYHQSMTLYSQVMKCNVERQWCSKTTDQSADTAWKRIHSGNAELSGKVDVSCPLTNKWRSIFRTGEKFNSPVLANERYSGPGWHSGSYDHEMKTQDFFWFYTCNEHNLLGVATLM